MNPAPPCVILEDDDLLVVRKPAGWNTHAPAPFAGEGLYEWLRDREPRWSSLAIIHRLDKETSGLILFAKTPGASQSLTAQFMAGQVSKRYLLLTDRPPPRPEHHARTAMVRTGDRYTSRPVHAGADIAETHFRLLASEAGRYRLEAAPLTGKTHQIRVHAAQAGFPILGDTLYGGTPARRVHLHAAALTFRHPSTGQTLALNDPPDFEADPAVALRSACIDPAETSARRLIHGAADGWPGCYVDQLGDALLAQSAEPPDAAARERLRQLMRTTGALTLYHKTWRRAMRGCEPARLSPVCLEGDPAGASGVTILENGLRFELRLDEGYSIGLFLDQRDNRRRLLSGHVAAGFPLAAGELEGAAVLNTFAYTCAFSVCAARVGARVTSLDLSRKYLDWGRQNFALNRLDAAAHDFIQGDVFDWARRLARKSRAFQLVILDPPTFSQSKAHGVFRAAKDYAALVSATLPLLSADGLLFASSNAADLAADRFVESLNHAIQSAGRRVVARHYAPQPPDYPVHREEPAHLKSVWMRIR